MRSFGVGVGVAAGALMACGGGSSDAKVTWSYELDFLSLAAAASVDSVEAQAFLRDEDGGDADCPGLVSRLRSGQALPSPSARSALAPMCDVVAGKAGSLEAPLGRYWLLVVARRADRDWLVGCASADVTGTPSGKAARVPLIPFDSTVAVPRTNCTSLGAKCSGACT